MLRFAPLLLLLACGGKSDDSAPTGGTSTPATLPLEGSWQTVFDGDALADSCYPISANTYSAQGFTVTHTGASTFDYRDASGTTVSCKVTNGTEFDCDPSTAQWSAGGVTLSDSVIRYGDVTTESELDLRLDTEMDCEGADCNNYGAYQGVGWPCSFVQRATATFLGR